MSHNNPINTNSIKAESAKTKQDKVLSQHFDDSIGGYFGDHSIEQMSGDFFQLNSFLAQSQIDRKTQVFNIEQLKPLFCDDTVPQGTESVEAYARWLEQNLTHKTINVATPKFIGHMTGKVPNFHAGISLLIHAMNQNMVKVETSGALTLVERQLTAIFHRLFFDREQLWPAEQVQDPDNVFGMVTSGGSVSNVSSLMLARNKALIKQGAKLNQIEHFGAHEVLAELGYKRMVIVSTSLAHYSIAKAAALLGIGQRNVRYVDAHLNSSEQTQAIEQLIEDCEQNNELVICVIGVAGATETGKVDPLEQIAQVATEHDVHFHVDGAWGGAFKFSAKHRHLVAGLELADSVTFCPHKQLYMPQGISLCVFKNPKDAHLIATHAVYQSKKGSFDLGQYTIEGSRPANCLHLHAGLHLLGRQGYGQLMDMNIERTQLFCQLIERSGCFELCEQPDLNIVNYRYIPSGVKAVADGCYTDVDNQAIDSAVQMIHQRQFANGEGFVSTTITKINGNGDQAWQVFRAVLCNPNTHESDMQTVLQEQANIAESP